MPWRGRDSSDANIESVAARETRLTSMLPQCRDISNCCVNRVTIVSLICMLYMSIQSSKS